MRKALTIILLISITCRLLGQDIPTKHIADYTVAELQQMEKEAIASGDLKLSKLYAAAVRKMVKLKEAEKIESKFLIYHRNRDLRNINGDILERYREIEREKEKILKKEEVKNYYKNIKNGSIDGPKFSFGIMPIVQLDYDNPEPSYLSGRTSKSVSLGNGLEFNGMYHLSNSFIVGSFLRLSFIGTNGDNSMFTGSSSTIYEEPADLFLATGGVLEYKIPNGVGLYVKGGVEKLLNYSKKAELVYGGGLVIYFNSSRKDRFFSFNVSGYRSKNQTSVKRLCCSTRDVVSYSDTFIFQMGLKLQFQRIQKK